MHIHIHTDYTPVLCTYSRYTVCLRNMCCLCLHYRDMWKWMRMGIVLEKFDSISSEKVGSGAKLHPCVSIHWIDQLIIVIAHLTSHTSHISHTSHLTHLASHTYVYAIHLSPITFTWAELYLVQMKYIAVGFRVCILYFSPTF